VANLVHGKQKIKEYNVIKIVFFAALREQLACSEFLLTANDHTNIAQVKEALIDQNPQWKKHLENTALLSAVNNNMVDKLHPVKSGDEVAFFPPVTGG